jgi:UDP-N-acetyl-D-mannosaminuronic acid transferase (WecB/TagA/CpsF family)
MTNETRAAEDGGEIVSGTDEVIFASPAIAIKALEDTVIEELIPSATRKTVAGLNTYWATKTLYRNETIEANLKGVHLTSGAVLAIYQA